ncbi:MAG: Ferredoxin--sulfite reductase [Hydrogenibacillus schlegelii]|uniref:Ferredoxin--sulfite reductase n=1 Tax=Hydrogenibacillus schlegelii TaxID=1484 RepID=A0A2T5GBR1_HYDSH|nr:NADPH-dependent assimilatory sulfite reductase hemoprotein subunit [Hydrogenibacillus schlegelii]PTQ53627.1 MAG: Ferredoxin--sulfite reductase [Hydrogenibacillus schlegelii]
MEREKERSDAQERAEREERDQDPRNDAQALNAVEILKRQSRYLRGRIQAELQNDAPKFSEESVQILKFHGVYQQDDRDLRPKLKKEGKERHWMMMVRARIPGGALTPEQYLAFDRLADQYSDYGTLRLTDRQAIQLHGVVKGHLKATIRSIHEALLTTLGACGDQVRNIVCCPAPGDEPYRAELREDTLALADRLGARTNAPYEIWLDGEPVELPEHRTEEPLYKEAYLPRKFKIALTPEGDNCVDAYAHDVGLVAHLDESRRSIVGYTILIGGGMGRAAHDGHTYPRVASPFAYVPRERLVDVVTAIVTVYRDYGHRGENRRLGRMKYLVEEKGIPWFREAVEHRIGYRLAEPRRLVWESSGDHLGWQREEDGLSGLGLFIPSGRIQDTEAVRLKSALRDIVREFRPSIRLTAQQNIILSGIRDEHRPDVEKRLREAGVPLPAELSTVRKNAMACVALPTCGLAVAEAERILPDVVAAFERLFEELGLSEEAITIRISGCPNGCSRPYVGEIAFVGRTLGKYEVYLGGDRFGTVLSERFREMVPLNELVASVRPVLEAYVRERGPGEGFGAFVRRVGLARFQSVEPRPS